jgi:hypothetical protein
MLAALFFAACGSKSRRAEIEARKAALVQKQDSALQATQQELALTDSLLELARRQYDEALARLHAGQSVSEQELVSLRQHRDSLQVLWEAQGAKIRYIRKRQEESQRNP